MKCCRWYRKRNIVALLVLGILSAPVFAQSPDSSAPIVEMSLDHGIRLNASDSSFGIRIGARFQSQFHSTVVLGNKAGRTVDNQVRTTLRRARLMLMGYLLNEEFAYVLNFQFDKGNSYISDAILRWHPNKVHTFGVGQFRVFDDRQFRISSAYLQLVERSVVSNEFTQGYDIGGYWQGSWLPTDQFGLNLYASATHGEWKNSPTKPGGFLYTGRVELLPFGQFKGGGDYKGGGLTLQPDPKLSLALAGSLNDDAYLKYGGAANEYSTDIYSLFTDFVFKYRHFSMMGEWALREVDHELPALSDEKTIHASLYSGYGVMLQAGNMILSAVELNVRYEGLRPEYDSEIEQFSNKLEDRYTLGTTYYIHGHSLKMQVEVTLVDEVDPSKNSHKKYLESRLQLQMNF